MIRGIKNIFAAFLIVISSFIVGSSVLPTYERVSDLREVIKEKETLFSSRTEIAAHINNLQAELALRHSELKRLSLVVPETKNTAELVSTLTDVAQKTGNIILAMKTEDAPSQNPSYDNLNFEITIEGNYAAMSLFVDYLTKNLRLIDIRDILVSLANQGGTIIGSPLLNSQIKGSTYVLKPSEQKINTAGSKRAGRLNEL